MQYQIICDCCNRPIPVNAADVGTAVICPLTRRLVPVTEASLQEVVATPRTRRGRRLAILALFLIAAGVAVTRFWARPQLTEPDADAADGGAAVIRGASVDPSISTPPGYGVAALPPDRPNAPLAEQGRMAPRSPDASPPPGRPNGPAGNTGLSPAPRPRPAGRTVPAATGRTANRAFASYRLEKRIDFRTSEALRKELLGVREVALDTVPGTSAGLIEHAQAQAAKNLPYPGPLVAAVGRPDLAGLPFLTGPDAALSRERAQNLAALSVQLRRTIQECLRPDGTDPRPDADQLYAALMSEGSSYRSARWATAEAVPCIKQMLQAEETAVRRMSIELLRRIDSPAATAALTSWSVFDLDDGCRAAAVDALRSRDQANVAGRLLGYLRYPWPRAAEHAAEALVALNCRSAVPQLAAQLALPAPDAPFGFAVGGSRTVSFRRELVRTNHARNCVLCHAPAASESDLVQGAIPDPSLPLPPPLTPAYYRNGRATVAADRTYLRQDFSMFQPAGDPGRWPLHQRYDYLVAVRDAQADTDRPSDPAYRRAVLFALRELSAKDLGEDASAWTVLRGNASASESLQSAVALALLSQRDSSPYLQLKFAEFGRPFLQMTEAERSVVSARLRRVFGWASFRLAMIAYLEPLTRTGDSAGRDLAARLLAQLVADTDRPAALTADELKNSTDLLGHKNAKLRLAAVGNLGFAKAWELLLSVLRTDPDPAVRREAALGLGGLENLPYRAQSGLVTAAGAEQDEGVRVAIATALREQQGVDGAFGKRIAELLLADRKWESTELQRAYLEALADVLVRLGTKADGAAGPLARAAARPGDVPTAVIGRVLTAAGPPPDDDMAYLVAALGNRDLRPAAASVLESARDRAVRPLIKGLRSEDVNVRAACPDLLARAAALKPGGGDSALWRAAIDALATAKIDPSAEVRAAARAALEKLTPAK